MTAVNPLPNALTWTRIVAGVLVFALLAAAALSDQISGDVQFQFELGAFFVFIIGAITDFFDGMLARKLHAETPWGATLDPIADKILVCGTILGLFTLGQYSKWIAIPSALILFREFTVSALRESAASRGRKLPVTFLAKWKTTFQLVALAAELLITNWAALHLDALSNIPNAPFWAVNVNSLPAWIAHGLMWIAALLTVWTGWEYVRAARRALPHEA
jgi:CDP-diacylglycerol--glycerol-3-phosphate 3-phosphatidyltransferase